MVELSIGNREMAVSENDAHNIRRRWVTQDLTSLRAVSMVRWMNGIIRNQGRAYDPAVIPLFALAVDPCVTVPRSICLQALPVAEDAHFVGTATLDLGCPITVPISRRMLTRAAPSPSAACDCVFAQIVFTVVVEHALNGSHLRTD
jgi:hypothetical protein